MKFLVCSLLLSGVVSAAQLKDVKSVYFYPMPGGFEQLLANRIAGDHIFAVVSDPKLADAVFTDQLGDAFLYKLDHIVTPPPVTAPGSSDLTPHASSFTRGKGTIFLVDAKSKQVVWSIYQRPKNASTPELNKTAKRIVEKLEIATGNKPAAN